MSNPFIPSYGEIPSFLTGRDADIDKIKNALKKRDSDPYKSVIITGARGSGKTVSLALIEDLALENGYIPIYVTAGKNLLRDIVIEIQKKTAEHISKPLRKIKAFNFGAMSITFEDSKEELFSFRSFVENIMDQLQEKKIGMVFLIDEIYLTAPGFEEISTAFQIFKKDRRDVALYCAGLPKNISDILLNDDMIKNLTFIRRSERIVLNDLEIDEVYNYYLNVFLQCSISLSNDFAMQMAKASFGYPFMIQLVGYFVFDNIKANKNKVTQNIIDRSIAEASERLDHMVSSSSYQEISGVAKEFLKIMSANDGPTKTSEIVSKMNKSSQYVEQYRRKLIAAGIIESHIYGEVDFAMPYLRQYVRKQIKRR